MEGYVKIYRSILDWEWAGNPEMLGFWVYMLMKAETTPRKWRGMVIKRGQFVTTVRELSEETGLSVRQIRTIFSKLQATNEMTNKTTNKYTIVTICNYERYNGVENDERQTKWQTKDKQATNKMTNKKKPETPVNTAIDEQPKTQSDKQSDKQKNKKPENGPDSLSNNNSGNNNIILKPVVNINPTIEKITPKKENYEKKKGTHKENEGIPMLSEEFALTGDDRKPIYDFVAPMFEKPFVVWLDYKRERKESYKSRKSLKVCYNHMVKMSGGDPSVAMMIVEQSMANNWAGLFELKSRSNGDNNRKTREQEHAERVQGYGKIVERLIEGARRELASRTKDEP